MSDIIFHNNILDKLYNNNIQNYIIYGSNGSGKRFLVKSLLYHKYKIDIDNSKPFKYETKINNTKYNINVYKSLYHYDIFINKNTQTYENIIFNFLKDYTESQNIYNTFNVFIINDLFLLYKLQNILAKYIEKSIHKFIIITNNYSSISNILKSNCISIRVPIPSIEKHLNTLDIKKEKKNIILKKYSYNLNIYFECLDIINENNFQKILDNNKIYLLYNKLVNIIIQKRISSLNNIKDIINELLLLNDSNIISDFYKYIYKIKLFNVNEYLEIGLEFSKIESMSKLGNNDIIFFENLIIFLKILYNKNNNI